MLRDTKGAWSVVCDRCFTVQAVDATTLSEAFDAAKAAGWMDQARKGKGIAKCPWLCPKCRPGDARTKMGRST